MLKKSILAVLFGSIFAGSVYASDLTLVRVGPTGSMTDLYTAAMSNRLKEKGWNTNVVGFNDCKGAEKWIKDNPKSPVMFIAWSDDFVLNKLQPDHPRACPSLSVSEKTLVTPINRSYHMICSRGDKSADDFMKGPKSKVAVWNHPVQLRVVQDLFNDFSLEHKIVGFSRGTEMIQALVSKDVDYVVMSSEVLAKNINGNCFLTTAPEEIASKSTDLKTSNPRISFEKFNVPMTRKQTGLIPLYVAYNVEIDKLRVDVKSVLLEADEYKNLWSISNRKAGFVDGKTAVEQWTELNSFLSSFK